MVDEVTLPMSRNIGDILGVLKKEVSDVEQQYNKLTPEEKIKLGENIMAEVMTPSMIMGAGSGDNLFGSGGGLIGGLILGSLLRNNGNLFGPGGAGDSAVLRNPPEQNQANMDLMAGIGQVDKAVAVSTAAMEGSQAAQSAAINASLNSVASSLVTRIDGTKEAVNAGTMILAQQINGLEKATMENRYLLSKDISDDGDKTRALLTQQYEMNLQRQLADANAAIVELRNENRLAERTRGIEVTTTNNINQAQAQQQQQQQFQAIAGALHTLAANIQSIRSTNEAINVGSGTLTASPANTNTNIR